MVDIDGVISLFGGGGGAREGDVDGRFHSIEGIPHFLSAIAAAHLLDLAEHFELVWASGWEDRAEDHLPYLLGVPQGLPFLRFDRADHASSGGARARTHTGSSTPSSATRASGRWRGSTTRWTRTAGRGLGAARRPPCSSRPIPRRGLTDTEVAQLTAWALELRAA